MSSCLVVVITFGAYLVGRRPLKLKLSAHKSNIYSLLRGIQFVPWSEMSALHRLQDWNNKSYLHFFFFCQEILGSHFKSQLLDLECVRQCLGSWYNSVNELGLSELSFSP